MPLNSDERRPPYLSRPQSPLIMFQDQADKWSLSPRCSPAASVSGSDIQLFLKSHGSLHSTDTSDHIARLVVAAYGYCGQEANLRLRTQSIRQALPELRSQAKELAKNSAAPPRPIPNARAETEWLPFINGARRKKMHKVGLMWLSLVVHQIC